MLLPAAIFSTVQQYGSGFTDSDQDSCSDFRQELDPEKSNTDTTSLVADAVYANAACVVDAFNFQH